MPLGVSGARSGSSGALPTVPCDGTTRGRNVRAKLLFVSLPGVLAACAGAPRGGSVSDVTLAVTHVTVIDVERGRVVGNQDVLIKGA